MSCDGRAHLNDLNVTWDFDLGTFMQERAQQTPAAGEAGDETPRDDGFVSRRCRGHLPGPEGKGRNSRDDGFVSRERRGRLLGPGRDGQK